MCSLHIDNVIQCRRLTVYLQRARPPARVCLGLRLGLWTGAGRVDAVEVTGKGGSASFVVKTIGTLDG